jgi:uncharacterized protein DUF955
MASTMTDDEIEQIAAEVLETHEIAETLPVDPLFVARQEDIDLLPGQYDDCFDGRIEYRRGSTGLGRFYLFYAEEEPPFRPEGRVRFSIAHELGHYYLPSHRQRLLEGAAHGSQSDFVSDRQREREADRFAARLLMPRDPFEDQVRRRGSFCTLKDLEHLAGQAFRTSLTSTVLRYVDLNFEPCCVVMAENGLISWSRASEDLHAQGLGWTQRGAKLPAGSVTSKARLSKLSGAMLTTSGAVDSSVWFTRRNTCSLWEEVYLRHGGRTLTFLTLEDRSGEYED